MDNQTKRATENLEVPTSLSRVQNEIAHLKELVDKLIAMLKPVLTDNVPTGVVKEIEEEFQCPLARDIGEQARQIAIINEQLEILIRHIQV